MNFNFKKIHLPVVILIIMTAIIIPVFTAYADVLIEPDNDFWRKNSNKMKHMVHNFYANGENGYVTFVVEPNSTREVFSVMNGEVVYITYTYTENGVAWGITEKNTGAPDNSRWESGWVQMEQLYVMYDSIIFYEENSAVFTEREFNVEDYYSEGDIVFWTWPGSGKTNFVMEALYIDNGDLPIDILGSTIYTDSDGNEWGYIAYIYGSRHVWVCLSDPSNHNIPAFNPAPKPDLIAAAPPSSGQSSNQRFSAPMLAISLVSLAAMLSLVLIRLFWDKKKK